MFNGMTDGTKRGSSGGSARAAKLTKEQRKEIASAAAKARWAKKTVPPVPVEPSSSGQSVITVASSGNGTGAVVTVDAQSLSTPEKRPKPRRRAMPKPFGAANSYAEKRLADAIKERAEAMGRVAALNAEIPSLVQIIKALKSTEVPGLQPYNPAAYQAIDQGYNQPSAQSQAPQVPYMPSSPMPPVPMAHGGAVGGPISDQSQELPEDYFLRDEVVGGKFV